MKTLVFASIISVALAQPPQQTTIVPPCTLNFTLSAAGSSPIFANSNPSCDKWTLTVYSVGFSGFSLTLQSAPAATPSTAGAFITYPGTTVTGSNPITATGIATFTNGTVATPYLRVTLSGLSGSGTVYGALQGSQSVNIAVGPPGPTGPTGPTGPPGPGGSGFAVQVNSTPLTGLTTLNLAAGANMTLTPTGAGTYTVTFASTGSSGGGGVPFGFTYTPPVPANWSLIGTGAAVNTITGVTGGSALVVTGPTGGGTNGPFGGITTPATGTNYTHVFVMYPILGGAGNVSDQICPVFTDGTNWEGPCVLYESGGSPGVGVTSLANSTFANAGSLANANGDMTSGLAIITTGVPVVFLLVKTGSQLQGYYCPDGQAVAASCFLLFTDTTPFLTPNAVALIAGARGGNRASIVWLESYL